MVMSRITTGRKVNVLVIFRQNVPHISPVKVGNNNRCCLVTSMAIISINYSIHIVCTF